VLTPASRSPTLDLLGNHGSSGARAVTGHLRRTVGVALPLLGLLASGCGRLGFETITDGGETDVDAGLRDAAMLDAAMVDAWRADDAGHDAATSPDASCVPVSSSCNEVHRLPAAPTIDGVIEPCLALNALTPAGWMVGRPGGYAFETLVQASELGRASWTLAAGQHVGLDLAVDVSTPDGSLGTSPNSCGSRTGQYFLRIDPTAASCVDPYCDSRAFCTPVLR
jgi:hypothetical protein